MLVCEVRHAVLARVALTTKRARDVRISVAVLAEILLRSPRKLFIFTIKKNIFRIKVSKK